MGRRSINTTKSGKYMNPTDQASKSFAYISEMHKDNDYLVLLLVL